MPLKKPSEFYDKNPNSSFDDVKEELKNAKPEKVERISEAFDSFKSNLNNLQSLSDFTETFDNFKSNVGKIETLSTTVEEIRENIQDLIGKKDLDDAMMAHLLFVEESIRNVQDKVKSVNANTLFEVKEEFDTLSEKVSEFLGEEVPAYKKLIVDSETRVDVRFGEFKEEVAGVFDTLGTDIKEEVSNIAGNLQGINEENLSGIKEDVKGIGNKVKTLVEKELPEYKKFFAETELKTEDRLTHSEEIVEEKLKTVEENYNQGIKGLKKDINQHRKSLTESKIKTEKGINKLFRELAQDIVTLDERLVVLDTGVTAVHERVEGKESEVDKVLSERIIKIENLVKESKVLSDTVKRDFKNREISSDKKLEEYANTLTSFASKITELETNLSDNVCELQENLDTSTSKYHDDLKTNVEQFEETLSDKLKDLQINFTVNEKHIEGIRKEFGEVVEKLQVDEIEQKNIELASKVRQLEEVLEKFDQKEILSEGLLNIPPNVDNSDPLTPLDKRYVTLPQLSEHYRLFVNRVQQQLATLGGGGAVRIDQLDDVVVGPTGVQTNGMVLKWNADKKWWQPGVGGAGAGGTWASNTIGVHTTRNVGINTTSAKSDYALWVAGKMGVEGDLEYDEATARNWNISGVATAAKMHVGVDTGVYGEDLVVTGNARIVGILTIGTSSIIIDGEEDAISIGSTIDGEDGVTITNSAVTIGAGVTISATASGINSAPNVLYVAKDGVDTNNGTSIDNAKLTIKAAVGIAQSGTTVKILSGRYEEENPIEVPAFVSLVGDDQRTVTVTPTTTTSDIFHVRKGTKLASMTFSGHLAPAAAVAFPTTEVAENVGGGKWKGPYIQNCTSDTTTGTGLYIDGDQARSLKAMNVDSYTQYNQGGVGVAITNGGFAQLVSLFTICCNEAVTCDKGGQADIANSNCSFGSYGLISRGVSDLQYSGIVTTTAAVSQAEVKVNVSTPTLNINNFVYDHLSGIATVTTTAAHGFQVGMGVTLAGIAVTCGAGKTDHTFVSGITSAITANNSTKYTASTGTTYDPLTGVMVIGIGTHSLTTSNTITIDNGGLTFTCDADSNATEHAYPRATDPISGISTAITAVSATTITVNVGAVSGSTTKTYPYQKPYVFDVDSVPSTTSFSVNVGVSKHIHNYVSGGTAKIDVDRPYDGQLVYFDTLYKDVNKIAVGSGGTGYAFTPTITVDAPTGPNGERATAFATLEGDSVASVTIISSGSQYTGTPNITISAPEEGSNTATASATMEDLYYTINSSTPVSSGISTLSLATNLLSAVGVGSTAYFSQGSRIVASSHTFEYVGAGNLIVTATPKRGGVTNQENEVVTETGGKVLYTSTDQAGNFRIGDDLQINQETGTISGRSFSKSLFSEMTPFILALS